MDNFGREFLSHAGFRESFDTEFRKVGLQGIASLLPTLVCFNSADDFLKKFRLIEPTQFRKPLDFSVSPIGNSYPPGSVTVWTEV